ncbi:MAG: preprotein translocase subunit YajC [Alkalimonas sp.]|uniref:Sec translocon accessory complex subunit YajC n=1 Tax=Alkalimonas delamerensis TaxID=265981 RepID=A0ABT9GQL8_9GAMM|nr:preprotein translocase subunit YajC [Alkalimonas delamerensis]MCC5851539.1 preprotein translocase subunit YajC [Alkalimonas sp.]MDP4529265.1 preprotein translocase subunit YajC [Alkalimonas delamerensis]
MSLFIANAHATTGGQSGGGWDLMIMLLAFGLIFYFLIYRPQAKRVKEHKNLMGALGKGDEVLTQGGLVGRISKISDEKDFIVLALNDSTEVTVQKASVSAVLPKGTLKSL